MVSNWKETSWRLYRAKDYDEYYKHINNAYVAIYRLKDEDYIDDLCWYATLRDYHGTSYSEVGSLENAMEHVEYELKRHIAER